MKQVRLFGIPFIEITDGNKNSVEITKDRNDNIAWTIKVYGNTGEEILAEIDRIETQLKRKYSK